MTLLVIQSTLIAPETEEAMFMYMLEHYDKIKDTFQENVNNEPDDDIWAVRKHELANDLKPMG